ncbi:hypothetical protein ACFU5O_14690 [Streptomyces sp. NPDC057445]|uniref:hypothetical protein n=1 Tax=Streptomyces sp. NPDC057445 TaxID=3346136 RepID=UPI0036C7E936
MTDQSKKLRGKGREAVGRTGESPGSATDDEELRLRGKSERVLGEVKEAAAKAGNAEREATDAAKGLRPHK